MDFPLIPAHLFSAILDVVHRGSDYVALHKTLRLVSKGVCRSLPKAPPKLKGCVKKTVKRWRRHTFRTGHLPSDNNCKCFYMFYDKADLLYNIWTWNRPNHERPCVECGIERRLGEHDSTCEPCGDKLIKELFSTARHQSVTIINLIDMGEIAGVDE
jgi:hypothetical protein